MVFPAWCKLRYCPKTRENTLFSTGEKGVKRMAEEKAKEEGIQSSSSLLASN
jgi:hypothetical protein